MILSTPAEIAEGLRLFMAQHQNPEPSFETEKMNRRQAAKFLDISYQTMNAWTKKGIIKEYGHGRKKFYLRSELIESMQNNG